MSDNMQIQGIMNNYINDSNQQQAMIANLMSSPVSNNLLDRPAAPANAPNASPTAEPKPSSFGWIIETIMAAIGLIGLFFKTLYVSITYNPMNNTITNTNSMTGSQSINLTVNTDGKVPNATLDTNHETATATKNASPTSAIDVERAAFKSNLTYTPIPDFTPKDAQPVLREKRMEPMDRFKMMLVVIAVLVIIAIIIGGVAEILK